MKVFIVISCRKTFYGALEWNAIAGVFSSQQSAKAFAAEKNRKASLNRYIVTSKAVDSK